MSIASRAFEAKVRIGGLIKSYLYYYNEGVRTHKQARQKARKHGKVISVEKVDTQALLGRIENLRLDDEPERFYLGGGVFEDELNLDEALGLSKKENRNKRIKNKSKDSREET